jgi:hypothetical protein
MFGKKLAESQKKVGLHSLLISLPIFYSSKSLKYQCFKALFADIRAAGE